MPNNICNQNVQDVYKVCCPSPVFHKRLKIIKTTTFFIILRDSFEKIEKDVPSRGVLGKAPTKKF